MEGPAGMPRCTQPEGPFFQHHEGTRGYVGIWEPQHRTGAAKRCRGLHWPLVALLCNELPRSWLLGSSCMLGVMFTTAQKPTRLVLTSTEAGAATSNPPFPGMRLRLFGGSVHVTDPGSLTPKHPCTSQLPSGPCLLASQRQGNVRLQCESD